MLDLTDYATALYLQAKQANVRYLVAIQGDWQWSEPLARQLYRLYDDVLWAGEQAPVGIQALPQKKARQWLGQECECLVFNAHQALLPDALGALSGTVTGGGILILLLPRSWGHAQARPSHQRLNRLLQTPDVIYLRQGQPLPPLPAACPPSAVYADPEFGCLSAEQTEAVHAIRRVVTGHRKRPLVLTADRGRGKSAALGIAAASLMRERPLRIVVTAPSFACAGTLFRHAARCLDLAYQQQRSLDYLHSSIEFMAPDALLSDAPVVDFLIVDEAAAIPAQLLQRVLARYNRIAFASTIHGYEGTGRGFAIKFRQQLDIMMPQWRALKLSAPIRWAEGDPLEGWIYRALLLDAEYPDLVSSRQKVTYRAVAASELLNGESSLSALFGLLVHAHYQTSPADLSQILDDESVQVIVAEAEQQVIGCVLLSLEGGFSESLAAQVVLGKRRPRGHLLAQSIAAHLGIASGAEQRCGRIMRIAVHPNCQQQGVGRGLLDYCRQWAQAQELDYLGTSFGLVPELFDFWRRAGYQPIRLGITKDAASGARSLLTVLPLSDDAQCWYTQARSVFAANFLAQRVEQFRDLETDLFCQLYRNVLLNLPSPPPVPTAVVEHQLQIYAQGGLGYDLIIAVLEYWISARLMQSETIEPYVQMAAAKVLQRQSWEQVIQEFGLSGKKQAEAILRQLVAESLE
ncbi:tRNA(Met) cytidine acetyltransferase TmcA [Photobacterium atrarenae]|uniref:tRNA(Met) cytidine acetyltransferase TmcA n=1 Tax=Photobacterium atrarenae TaxID=865757 RepID=A0ABY5GPC0_9GAMM|nr:GNAT family N-acetyltransferase [Photobacterium atrarenae]UTV30768.1 GNAT family N-acetyltransferase [Photobacterium atrarenae]